MHPTGGPTRITPLKIPFTLTYYVGTYQDSTGKSFCKGTPRACWLGEEEGGICVHGHQCRVLKHASHKEHVQFPLAQNAQYPLFKINHVRLGAKVNC
jgi:hypothetical protein